MNRRLARALSLLAVPALLVPAVATSAVAAPAPKVPSLGAVDNIYPHLKGGDTVKVPVDTVYGPGKKCSDKVKIKGAKGTAAVYLASGATTSTGKKPSLSVAAYRLPSTAKASSLIKAAQKCPAVGLTGGKAKVTKFKVNLGNQSWGYTVKGKVQGSDVVANVVMVRQGKYVVSTAASSMDKKKPSVAKTIKLAKLAVKTAS